MSLPPLTARTVYLTLALFGPGLALASHIEREDVNFTDDTAIFLEQLLMREGTGRLLADLSNDSGVFERSSPFAAFAPPRLPCEASLEMLCLAKPLPAMLLQAFSKIAPRSSATSVITLGGVLVALAVAENSTSLDSSLLM
jgi:hypothetical protein